MPLVYTTRIPASCGDLWPFSPALIWGPLQLSPLLVRAEWARSTVPVIPSWAATYPSRFCPKRSHVTLSAWRGSSVKPKFWLLVLRLGRRRAVVPRVKEGVEEVRSQLKTLQLEPLTLRRHPRKESTACLFHRFDAQLKFCLVFAFGHRPCFMRLPSPGTTLIRVPLAGRRLDAPQQRIRHRADW